MSAPVIAADNVPVAHRPALYALAGGAFVGLMASIFIPAGGWGFGFPVVALLIFGITHVVRMSGLMELNRKAELLWIGIIGFALLFAWRDSPALRTLNLLVVAVFTGTMALRMQGGAISKGSVYDYPLRALGAWFVAFVDTINLLATDISWRLIPQKAGGRHAAAAIRGLLLATPILLIFGALFINADAGFEKLLTGSIQIDPQMAFEQLLIGGAFAWFSAGLFRRMYVGIAPTPPNPNPLATVGPPRLGGMELGIVLGSLNLLFLLFVSTQWRYFFGGAEVIKATAGLGVAEFARRGFFELVAVAGLTLPILLGLHALADPENGKIQKLYKTLASTMVVLLTVVMHSAWLKMHLYMETFGLSTLRVYVAATLVWLAIVFVWFTLTTLNQRANRFAWGSVLAFAATLVGLNILNPDRFVANWNIQHQEPGKVDWKYLSSLSADAAPVLAKAWDKIPEDKRGPVADALARVDGLNLDWRSQNLALLETKGIVGANRDAILKLADSYVDYSYGDSDYSEGSTEPAEPTKSSFDSVSVREVNPNGSTR
jgi:hypothetical protein